MELLKQITSFVISKRLKELGVDQRSQFKWWKGAGEARLMPSDWSQFNMEPKPMYDTADVKECFSSFTVAELGEMLPARVKKEGEWYMLECMKHAKWEVKYVTYRNGIGFVLNGHGVIQHGEEAEARGRMLVYLLENNLIQYESNQR